MLAPIRTSPIIPICIADSFAEPIDRRVRFRAPYHPGRTQAFHRGGTGPNARRRVRRVNRPCPSPLTPALPVAPDEVVRRAVVAERGLRLALQLRDDALSQHLAQLDPPLIEGVDVPDRALGEHAVLVERDELSERVRREPLGQDRVRRPIALEHPMGNETVWS